MTRTQEIDLAPRGGLARRLPLLAGVAPLAGALLSWDPTGYVHGLVAGEAFAGICTRSVRPGGYLTDGLGQVDAMTGQFLLTSTGGISGIDATDVAAATVIYASDDSTFTGTAGSNTKIGAVAGFDGSRVVIMARTADIAAADAPPPATINVLVGRVTFVDSVNGSDVTGTPGDQTLPYATIEGAVADSAVGDAVVVWPGTYTPSGSGLDLKPGVRLHGLPGAKITKSGAGHYCIADGGGAASSCQVTGSFQLIPTASADGVVMVFGGSVFNIECASIIVTGAGRAVYMSAGELRLSVRAEISNDTGRGFYLTGNATVRADAGDIVTNNDVLWVALGASCSVILRSRDGIYTPAGRIARIDGDGNFAFYADGYIGNGGSDGLFEPNHAGVSIYAFARNVTAPNGSVVKIISSAPEVNIEAVGSISAGQIIVDTGSSGATHVSVKAPTITATAADHGVKIGSGGVGAQYTITSPELTCGIGLFGDPANVLRVITGKQRGHAGAPYGIYVSAGNLFLNGDEFVAVAGGHPSPLHMSGGTAHVMRGRMIGLDGDAAGHAIVIENDAALTRVYSGAVLIAGNDAAAKSIGLSGIAATPTVLAMGDIAANKAADGGVVVAVGSLLVDAAVV